MRIKISLSLKPSIHLGRLYKKGPPLTEHLADVRLDVHILQVLVRVGVVEAQRGVQPDRHPHAVADPSQLAHLALPTRVGVKGLLQGGGGGGGGGSEHVTKGVSTRNEEKRKK